MDVEVEDDSSKLEAVRVLQSGLQLGHTLLNRLPAEAAQQERNPRPQLNPETRNFNFLKDECSQVLELKLLRATRLLQGLLVSRSRRDMLKCASMPLCPKFGTEAAPSASSSSRKSTTGAMLLASSL